MIEIGPSLGLLINTRHEDLDSIYPRCGGDRPPERRRIHFKSYFIGTATSSQDAYPRN
jgi:hypothetical protein